MTVLRICSVLLVVWLASAHAVESRHSEEYAKWRAERAESFSSYLSEQDQAFIGYLDAQWKEFDTQAGVVRDPTPKPVTIPVAPSRPQDDQLAKPAPLLKPVKPVVEPPSPPVPPPAKPEPKRPAADQPAVTPKEPPPKAKQPDTPEHADTPTPTPTPTPKAHKMVTVAFFGNTVALPEIKQVAALPFAQRSNTAVSTFWKQAAQLDVEHWQQVLEAQVRQQQLNDWALMQMVRGYADKVFPHDQDRSVLLQWFLLTRLGYHCKIGLSNLGVHLYLPVQQKVYQRQYLELENQRYYVDLLGEKRDISSLKTYQGRFPGADKVLSLSEDVTELPDPAWRARDLQFSFRGTPVSLKVHYDVNKVGFLDSYPQTEFGFYFNSRPVTRTEQELLDQLRPHIEPLPEQEAVNFLLRFVQTAFEYKTDEEGFGYENYLFTEETLHYPYSDCEDRSVLFAWLVRNLLDLPVKGILYPGHLATAVALTEPPAEGRIQIGDRVYTVADPTYINADVGMVMPQFMGVAPQSVVLVR